MSTETALRQLHQVVSDYQNHRVSRTTYRFHRRQLLDQLDAWVNGRSSSAEEITKSITVRKRH
ncbi:hypothetical protein [Marinimicrobium sp. ARAG 43.8]|uniref:hypothetical protein n=1 Tax=Marinimicrobium sp. ARAG 43.8 TaxID=3418719 RepID=UPI003CF433FF